MKIKYYVIAAVAFSAPAIAEVTYTPLPLPNTMLGGTGALESNKTASDAGAGSLALPGSALTADNAKCATPPTLEQLSTLTATVYTMSVSTALNLGFPVGSVGVSTDSQVLVQEWKKSATCTAGDGVTEVVYGQAIRVVAASNKIDANLGLTIPVLAANATLNGSTTNIQAQTIGFNNAELSALVAQIYGPIDVTTFPKISDLMSKLALKAPTLTGGSVVRLGIVNPINDILSNAIAAYSAQQISDGKSCTDTKSNLMKFTTSQYETVESVYKTFSVNCDTSKPDAIAQARASAALGPVRVRLR